MDAGIQRQPGGRRRRRTEDTAGLVRTVQVSRPAARLSVYGYSGAGRMGFSGISGRNVSPNKCACFGNVSKKNLLQMSTN